MAGLSGKSAWFGLARQPSGKLKGTATAAPVAPDYKVPFSGGNINPVRETDRLSETDVSRDQGAAYVTTGGVEGSPELYVRDRTIPAVLYGAMGEITSTGVGPDYTHEIKLSEALPWWTFFRNVGGATGVFEKFLDCQIGSATISAEAGAPLTASLGVQGLTPEWLAADPAAAVDLEAQQVFNFNNATVTLGQGAGTLTNLVRSFELTIENNLERQQTDDVSPFDIVAGTREISLGFDMIFENKAEYKAFHYGAGTALSPDIYTSAAKFSFVLGVNNEVTFELPSIAYEEYPVEPDAGGAPIIVSVRAVAQKAEGIDDLLIATVKNQVASYVA